jgi:hypothetical protein
MQPPESGYKLVGNLVKGKRFRPLLGDDVVIAREKKRFIQPVEFAQFSLDAVADDGVAYLLAHREADPGGFLGAWQIQQDEVGAVLLVSAAQPQEFSPPAQPLCFGKP